MIHCEMIWIGVEHFNNFQTKSENYVFRKSNRPPSLFHSIFKWHESIHSRISHGVVVGHKIVTDNKNNKTIWKKKVFRSPGNLESPVNCQPSHWQKGSLSSKIWKSSRMTNFPFCWRSQNISARLNAQNAMCNLCWNYYDRFHFCFKNLQLKQNK